MLGPPRGTIVGGDAERVRAPLHLVASKRGRAASPPHRGGAFASRRHRPARPPGPSPSGNPSLASQRAVRRRVISRRAARRLRQAHWRDARVQVGLVAGVGPRPPEPPEEERDAQEQAASPARCTRNARVPTATTGIRLRSASATSPVARRPTPSQARGEQHVVREQEQQHREPKPPNQPKNRQAPGPPRRAVWSGRVRGCVMQTSVPRTSPGAPARRRAGRTRGRVHLERSGPDDLPEVTEQEALPRGPDEEDPGVNGGGDGRQRDAGRRCARPWCGALARGRRARAAARLPRGTQHGTHRATASRAPSSRARSSARRGAGTGERARASWPVRAPESGRRSRA